MDHHLRLAVTLFTMFLKFGTLNDMDDETWSSSFLAKIRRMNIIDDRATLENIADGLHEALGEVWSSLLCWLRERGRLDGVTGWGG